MDKKSFNRKSLTNKIYKEMGFSKSFSSTFIDNFFESIILEIIKNKKLKISSFGTFKILNKKERVGRNPKTKERAIISSRKIINFKASSWFKKKINDK